jgi:hypothetical protein
MICEVCNKRPAIEQHHLFSQSKVNKKYYGANNEYDGIDWLNDPRNILDVCRLCHTNERALKLTEINFARIMGIVPRSKTGLVLWHKIGEEI